MVAPILYLYVETSWSDDYTAGQYRRPTNKLFIVIPIVI